jgi:hypothetical protein
MERPAEPKQTLFLFFCSTVQASFSLRDNFFILYSISPPPIAQELFGTCTSLGTISFASLPKGLSEYYQIPAVLSAA